ncbi:MAG TPA: hypothetical protein DDZ80_11985 [Cyanobacteria bacterium UBA8803]|nr:hypothetical protein [Cyanobacteria bacterium UBA8803]
MHQLQFLVFVILSIFFSLKAIAASPSDRQQECTGEDVLTANSCVGDSLESEEAKLYELVNQYRSEYGLPPIPFSPSLSIVANRHVRDLEENIGSLTHAWSNCYYDGSDPNSWYCI